MHTRVHFCTCLCTKGKYIHSQRALSLSLSLGVFPASELGRAAQRCNYNWLVAELRELPEVLSPNIALSIFCTPVFAAGNVRERQWELFQTGWKIKLLLLEERERERASGGD
jgi:hypothetical protein